MTRSRRAARWRHGLSVPGRVRRRLASIEGALETEVRLASMFATFNAVTRGEPASGPDPLRRPRWRPPSPGAGRGSASSPPWWQWPP